MRGVLEIYSGMAPERPQSTRLDLGVVMPWIYRCVFFLIFFVLCSLVHCRSFVLFYIFILYKPAIQILFWLSTSVFVYLLFYPSYFFWIYISLSGF